MKHIKKLMNSENRPVIILDALFVLYILFDIGTPIALAKIVDNAIGKIVVIMFALGVFYAADPLAGVLALIVAYSLITRSSRITGSIYRQPEHEAEEIKMQMLRDYNSFPRTLEEDVISDMSPIIRDDGGMNADYTPVLGNLNNAAPIGNGGGLM
jgi:hypothetical protein